MDRGLVTLIGMSIAYIASFVGMGLAYYAWRRQRDPGRRGDGRDGGAESEHSQKKLPR